MPVPELRDPAERVSPRARLMWWCADAAAGAALLAALAVAVLTLEALRWWLLVPAGLLVTAYAAAVPHWRYLVHRWEATDTAVYTQTGWWARERRIAPMSRIQTVEYAEGPLARLFGLASVRVTTASAAGALVVDGLDAARARVLVEELAARADAVQGDAT